MIRLTIYDIVILHQHFATKKKPSAKDKELAKKLDAYLAHTAEGLKMHDWIPTEVV